MQERIDGFGAQGFTPEILGKLEPMIARGGEDLLKQVETAEKCSKLKRDLACVKKSKTDLMRSVRVLKREKEKLQGSVVSIRNQVDELRLQMRPIRDAVNTVVWLLKKGYRTEDIKSMGYGLDFLGVDGDADLSISRLITGLKKQKDLTVLDGKLTRKREEFAELDSAIEDAIRTLAIVKDVTLKSINEAKGASIQALHSMAEASNEAFAATCERFDGCSQSLLQDFGVRAEERIEWMEEQYRQRRETDQQKTLFERTLAYGRLMQGLFESDEYLLTVSLSWMLQLARRLNLWVRERLPSGTVLPSNSILQRQVGLIGFQPYNIAVLTELACEGLEAVSSKEPVHLNGAKAGVNSSQG